MKSRFILLTVLLACGHASAQVDKNSTEKGVQITKLEDRVRVEVGGSLFTEYFFTNVFNPYCYPMLGPGGVGMTRNWPLKTVPNEEHDHPHHRSFWYAHGDVNGINFWSEETSNGKIVSGKIVHQGFTKLESGAQSGVIVSSNNWVAPSGQLVCSDVRTMRIYQCPNSERMFDFEITLYAPADKAVVFGDTKEGTMAMRLAETMRLKQPGNKPGQGHIVMSNGSRDDAAWGTHAKWAEYYGPVDGKTVGVAIFDHPANPRFPTTWHARDYGLVAANPYGWHDFERKPKGAGDMTVPAGTNVKFRYRFYLHEGNAEAKLPAMFDEFAYPAIPDWKPDASQRENLRRALTLLATSTPEKHHTVRVLFYGQSITEQDWSRQVERYLRTTYPNVNFVIENRAIGGHSSQLLVKTAEADLYPFQPDLLIFHVYGSHIDYESIIRNARERTCADILLQTDHITKESSMTEEMDPAKLTPAQWDAWMNQSFLPGTAAKYRACRADIHELWKTYLDANNLKPAALLRDGVHLNSHGDWLMANLIEPYLAPLSGKTDYDPFNDSRVHTVTPQITGTSAKVEFDGTRCDLVFKAGAKEPVQVLIDGKKPSECGSLYGFTRVSAFPQSNWPILLKVGSQSALTAETWALKIDQIDTNGTVCHFALTGSITGDDGEGISTSKFVSKSGRIVIEPGDWNLKYCTDVFKRPLPEGHIATWKSILLGADLAQAPAPQPGIESVVTVAQGLPAGKHVLELTSPGLPDSLQAVRTYAPTPKN